jgi:hypothetical protein
MRRRRPGRHAHGACLPVTTALLGLALAAGCSSSGATPTTAPPSRSSTPPTSTPAPPTTPSQTPVALPVTPSPTPVERKIARPAGAKIVDFRTCITPSNIVILFLQNQFFAAPDLSLQLIQLQGAGRLAAAERKRLEKARRVWLRDGYPASYPMVRELDTFIDIYTKVSAAAKARNVEPLPGLYLRLLKVDAQYGADSGTRSVCEQ